MLRNYPKVELTQGDILSSDKMAGLPWPNPVGPRHPREENNVSQV